MRKQIFTLAAACVAFGSMAAATPAFAQDDEEAEEADGPITISGGIALVSDYRFRGVSLSDKDFAIQPTITISHESGLYVGAWASNIANNPGDDIELDIYAGFAGGETVTYDIGATYYVYPGASALNYVELIGKTGLPAIKLVRGAAAAGITDETPDAEVIRAIVADPNLLQRPIVEAGDKAVIARPIDKALELLDK